MRRARNSAAVRQLLDMLRQLEGLSGSLDLPDGGGESDVLDVIVWLDGGRAGERAADRRWKEVVRSLELRCMPYRDYLQTPEWAALREERLFADDHRCRFCNSAERLEVHHRTYERRGQEDIDDLSTVCHACHQTLHANRALARARP